MKEACTFFSFFHSRSAAVFYRWGRFFLTKEAGDITVNSNATDWSKRKFLINYLQPVTQRTFS